MSSIADALKRAQQERDRMRSGDASSSGAPAREDAPDSSLASVVLRKNEPPPPPVPDASSTAVSPPTRPAAATPLADAIRQAPKAPSPAARARQVAAETIVEDYASKHRLNLPHSMVAYHDRSGPIAEQYRKIRDNLMAANPKREPQSLVITSARPGEGKTTTAINLGLSLVELRMNRVLLVDGCLPRAGRSRRSLTELLKLGGVPGFGDLLATPEDDAQPLIKATPWNHLYILPAGNRATVAAATELFKSPALRPCLRQFRALFDWVLIDAPAALTIPHAGLLGACTDGILLALALHHTPREAALTTVRRLKSVNVPVKACILTHA